MTYCALRQSLKRMGVKAGVPRLRAHLFRHTSAVRYLMNGGDNDPASPTRAQHA
jgi:integrase